MARAFGAVPFTGAYAVWSDPIGLPAAPGSKAAPRQRVAIARALASRRQLLIADEPAGQLDVHTGRQIMRLPRTVVRSEGITVLVATHDPVLIDLAGTTFRLDDGILSVLQ